MRTESRSRAFKRAISSGRSSPWLPKMGYKYLNMTFWHKFRKKPLKVCYKVSLSKKFQRQSCSAINYLWSVSTFWQGMTLFPYNSGLKASTQQEGCAFHVSRAEGCAVGVSRRSRSRHFHQRKLSLLNVFFVIRPPDIVCRRTYILPVFFLLSFFLSVFFFSPSNLRGRWTELNENRPHGRK